MPSKEWYNWECSACGKSATRYINITAPIYLCNDCDLEDIAINKRDVDKNNIANNATDALSSNIT